MAKSKGLTKGSAMASRRGKTLVQQLAMATGRMTV